MTTTDRSSTPDGEVKQIPTTLWWMPLIRGILLVIFGVLMFTQPSTTLLSLLWFMGIYWIVDGIFSIIEGVRGHPEKSRIWMFLGGIVSILAGIFILGNPIVGGLVSGTFIVYLIGFSIIISGVMRIFAGRNSEWTWGGLIMGILYVLFGIFIVTHPILTLASLVWLISIWAMVSGIFAITLAFVVRGTAS